MKSALWRQNPLCSSYLFCLILLFPAPALVAADSPLLSLAESERLALQNDPLVKASLARSEALDADAVADAQLPDLKLRTGLYNVPLDDFDLRREPSAQLRLGVQQAFPRGDILQYKSLKTRSQASVERRLAKLEWKKLLREVRNVQKMHAEQNGE